MSERDQNLKQVERLVASHTLHSSESLCKLLRYLVIHALDHPGAPMKEYQIATEVFGRPPDFDPQLDSTIRVQAGRLRLKLAEYYASEGADDALVVDLPKGTYVPSFHHRASGNGKAQVTAPHELSLDEAAQPDRRRWMIATAALSILFLVSVAAIIALWGARKATPGASPTSEQAAPAAFQVFWKPFASAQEEPWVIFSNAAFVGRPETGIRYFNSAQDSRGMIFDHYTGVGEVLAVHDLDEVFALLHRQIRVKRGSLFSLDDAKNNDLIFVGSPSENLTLLEIPGTQDFVFRRLDSGPRKGDLAIVNVHPQPGEPKDSLASPASSPLTEDYAVIGLLPGLNQSRFELILAGTTTFGTQGAVEYVCRESSVQELLLRLSVSKTGELKPFEALLRVKVTHGVPVDTELVALRERIP